MASNPRGDVSASDSDDPLDRLLLARMALESLELSAADAWPVDSLVRLMETGGRAISGTCSAKTTADVTRHRYTCTQANPRRRVDGIGGQTGRMAPLAVRLVSLESSRSQLSNDIWVGMHQSSSFPSILLHPLKTAYFGRN